MLQPTIYQKKFRKRQDRTEFILSHFPNVLKTSVLDVGCYEAPLRELLPDTNYFGIDIVGKPDLVLNLEEAKSLPIDDGQYETTCCFEVLEHLDSFHRVFKELFRTAEKHVLVSLPNCWCSARSPLERGSGEIAHYQLPQDKPVDRHKWFINSRQIINFFEEYAQNTPNVTLERTIAAENERPTLIRSLRKLRHGKEGYLNRYIHTVVAHFRVA
jgi:2-polyprenyl-3-methyl-5-hydroxy-6-metoxy-1,4-benzoquinol methylase